MSDITLINISIARKYNGKIVYERNAAGVFYLIAALEEKEFAVSFHEHFLHYGLSFSQEVERLAGFIDPACRVIGIGCHSVHLPFVVAATRELKRRYPLKKIVLGGIGPTSVAVSLCQNFEWIDAVAVGESESTIVEIMERVEQGFSGIRGVIWRNKGDVMHSEPRMPCVCLDELPFPAYSRMDFSMYQIPTVITSRGCPHRCPFCSLSTFWGKSVRYRSVGNVLEEIRLLAGKYGVQYVFFGDATFLTDKKRIIALCDGLRKEKLGVRWECLVRIDDIDTEMMGYMSDAGCEAVFYGLESGSQRVLSRVKQGVTVPQALNVIQQSRDYFKTVEVSLMWGFPFETYEDFKETLDVRNRLEKEFCCEVQLRWLEPYPATALHEQYKNQLFYPEAESLMYDEDTTRKLIGQGKDFYEGTGSISGIKITADVTNVRFIIAASYTASLCNPLIKENPHIFPDYYRFKTPDLEKKLPLVQKHSLY